MKILKRFYRMCYDNISVIIGALLGITFFFVVFGYKTLDFSNIDIALKGDDTSQHYYGWEHFRISAWQFPLGLFDNASYPGSISIVFTDSIPIFAIFFKILSPILPNTFQYLGLFVLVSYILQGALSAKLILKYSNNNIVASLGSGFFVLSTVLIQRPFYHTALSAHFLIIAAMLIVAYRKKIEKTFKACIVWGVLAILCVGIHMYFLPMCGAILLVYCVIDISENKRVLRSVLALGTFVFSALFMAYVLGAFSTKVSSDPGLLTEASANLNTLFNPAGYSKLPSMPYMTYFQSEGFAYLGLGIMLLVIVTTVSIVYLTIKNKHADKVFTKTEIIAYICCGIVLFVLSLSPRITFSDKILVDINLPQLIYRLWSIFRATGRFIWPVYYFIILYAVCMDCAVTKKFVKIIIVAVFLCIQTVDLIPGIKMRADNLKRENIVYDLEENEVWRDIAKTGEVEHIIFMSSNIYRDGGHKDDIYSFAEYAKRNGMTLSGFPYAHSDFSMFELAAKESIKDPKKDQIFIFTGNEAIYYVDTDMYMCTVGKFTLLTVNDSLGFEKAEIPSFDMELSFGENYFTNGEYTDDGVIIGLGQVCYGPYIDLPSGVYKVVIIGEGLDSCDMYATAEQGQKTLEGVITAIDYQKAEVNVFISAPESKFEIVISNAVDANVIVNSVSISRET